MIDKMMWRTAFITIPVFLLLPIFQQDARPTLDPASTMVIEGGSNVRDWTADVSGMRSNFVLSGFSGRELRDLRPEHFRSLELRIPVRNIDTGNRGFTRNLQKYLLMDQHPEIVYQLQQVDGISMDGGNALIRSSGTIDAAGRRHPVKMQTHATMNQDGSIQFTGEQPLLMTDFGIDPPTAVLGTIRAHDAVKVVYNVRYRP